LRSIRNATYIMTESGRLHRVPYYEKWTTITELGTKQGLLEHSLWLRKRLGLRRQTLAKIRRIIE
jgi:hypothetical protein